jgi:hypothetical protein
MGFFVTHWIQRVWHLSSVTHTHLPMKPNDMWVRMRYITNKGLLISLLFLCHVLNLDLLI